MKQKFNRLMKLKDWSVAELEEALDMPYWTRYKLLNGLPVRAKKRREIKARIDELLEVKK